MNNTTMKNRRIVLSLLCIFCAFVTHSRGAVVTLQGSFSGDFSGPISTLSGTWKASYDDTNVNSTGFTTITVTPIEFSLTPSTIGSTTFTASEVDVDFQFNDGVISVLYVGGSAGGASGTTSLTDDFRVVHNAFVSGQNVTSMDYNVFTSPGSITGFRNADTVSGSYSAVPEPSNMLLLSLAGGLFLARRRKH